MLGNEGGVVHLTTFTVITIHPNTIHSNTIIEDIDTLRNILTIHTIIIHYLYWHHFLLIL